MQPKSGDRHVFARFTRFAGASPRFSPTLTRNAERKTGTATRWLSLLSAITQILARLPAGGGDGGGPLWRGRQQLGDVEHQRHEDRRGHQARHHRSIFRTEVQSVTLPDRMRIRTVGNQIRLWDATGQTHIGINSADKYPRSHDMIAFGAPSLIALDDGDLMASWWCTDKSITHPRWARVAIDE